jgi:hypothetical protein
VTASAVAAVLLDIHPVRRFRRLDGLAPTTANIPSTVNGKYGMGTLGFFFVPTKNTTPLLCGTYIFFIVLVSRYLIPKFYAARPNLSECAVVLATAGRPNTKHVRRQRP